MKGLIMAGGRGTRLKPLTCDCPKPMVPVCNQPIMTYAMELLRSHGVTHIGVTIQYLPERIRNHYMDGRGYGVRLSYFTETSPLGTAGSVKNAERMLDETFVVVSGDALTSIDLSKAFAFHRDSGAAATLVLARVGVPLEYGVVITDDDGRISRFVEKPNWSEVFSDTVNTGIYILEPHVLSLIPEGKAFDFSKDLFPLMMEKEMPLYGYVADEYWCDVGDLESYRTAQFDTLDGNTGINLPMPRKKDRLWVSDTANIGKHVTLTPPCVIGSHVKIADGVRLGPYAVVGDGCIIEQNASVKKSILWARTRAGEACEIRGAVLCRNVKAGANCTVLEGSVVGDRCALGPGVMVKPDVRLWPGKKIGANVTVSEDVVWGTGRQKTLFRGGVASGTPDQMNPAFLSRAAAAFAEQVAKENRRIAVAWMDFRAQGAQHSLLSGISMAGYEAWDMGQATMPMVRAAVRYFRMAGGFCISSAARRVSLEACDGGGADLTPGEERKIENILAVGEQTWPGNGRVLTLPGFESVYAAGIARIWPHHGDGVTAALPPVACTNPQVRRILKEVYGRANIRVRVLSRLGNETGILLYKAQNGLSIVTEDGPVRDEITTGIIAQCCMEFYREMRPVLPFSMPQSLIDAILPGDREPLYVGSGRFSSMEAVRKQEGIGDIPDMLGAFGAWFDPAVQAVLLSARMAKEGIGLSELVKMGGECCVAEREVECPWEEKGRILRTLVQDAGREGERAETREGIRLIRHNGRVLVLPDVNRPVYRIYADAVNVEAAESLAEDMAEKVRALIRPETPGR